MVVTTFDTTTVAAADRFAHWVDLGCRSLVPTWVRSDHEKDFRAWLRVVDLGRVQVSAMAYPSVWVRRSATLVRRSGPEAYQINLILNGHTTISQGDREVSFGAGQLVLFDTSRPFHGRRSCSPDTTTAIVAQVPRSALALPSNTVDRLAVVPIPATSGVGGVFARWLVALNQRAEELTPVDSRSLASITTELLCAVLAHHSDLAVSPHAHRAALRVRVRDFIHHRLADPTLSVADIATAHRISVRHLHRLFEQEGVTVASWIRRERLEHCRRDLADPRLRDRPIQDIARRWGFSAPAHFSRAFRDAYGQSPTDYRHQQAEI